MSSPVTGTGFWFGVRLPDADGALVIARGQQPAVMRKGQALDAGGMVQLGSLLAAGQVPKAHPPWRSNHPKRECVRPGQRRRWGFGRPE